MDKMTQFINTYNYKNLEYYTNSQREFSLEIKDHINDRVNSLMKELKVVFEGIKEELKARNIEPKYILYTGQSLSTYIINFLKFRELTFTKDLDIFIMDYRDMSENSFNDLFENSVIDEYDNLSVSNYGYRILNSEKINYFDKKIDRTVDSDLTTNYFLNIYANKPLLINYVFYKDLYSEFAFKELDPMKRYLLSYLSTLNYFDLNNVQIGLMIDLKTLQPKILYTDNFYDFLVNKQFAYNKKRISRKTILRASNKLRIIQNTFKLNKSHKRRENIFYDKDYHKSLMALFNIISSDFYNRMVKKHSQEIIYEDILFYNNLVTIAESFKDISIDGSFTFNEFDRKSKIYKDIQYILKDKETLSKFLLESFKIGPIKNLPFDYVKIPDEYYERINFVLDLLGKENFLYSDITSDSLIFKANMIIHLSKLSQKKLLNIKEYFERKNKITLFKNLLIYINLEPRLLKLGIDKLEFLSEIAYNHHMQLFEIPFKFSLDPLKTVNIILDLFEIFSKKKKEVDFEISIDSFIGVLENNALSLWKHVFEEKDLEEFIEEKFEIIKKENEKLLAKFHDFKKIKIEIEEYKNYICEELINGLELKREGDFMKHCVGGYAQACQNFDSVIFSFYLKDRGPYAKYENNEFRYTMEINPITFRVVQIRGKRNKGMEDEHIEIINKLKYRVIKELEKRKDFYTETKTLSKVDLNLLNF